jgi:hypothetical protein
MSKTIGKHPWVYDQQLCSLWIGSRWGECVVQVYTFFIDYQSLRELRIISVIIIATAENMLCV